MNRDLLRGESIYSVFIRNHTERGDIQGLINDLDRIKSLGVTTIWILPHYPIGKVNRKGEMGSPYAISDYLTVNPDLGGINDFKDLVDNCHRRGLKLLIDIVFNHTSCDSILMKEHPDWFIKSPEGDFLGKVAGWTDVYDLDFSHPDLCSYLIGVLDYWAEMGIDGFRCDVASVVPLSFWVMAKDTLNSNHKELIWLAESVDKEFVSFIRHKGYPCHSDSELYTVFDILYDYDVQNVLEGYVVGDCSFDTFVQERRNQEVVYPKDYLKLRFLENHDSKVRAAEFIKDFYKLKNWKAFSMFEKGVPLIYAGEEIRLEHKSDLFNIDVIKWDQGDDEYTELIKKLLRIDHMHIVTSGIYTINPLAPDCVHLRYRYNGETLHGIFNFGEKSRLIKVEVLEGDYLNLVNNEKMVIDSENLDLKNAPFIFKSIP